MLDQSKIFSIKELNSYIKSILDETPALSGVWIRGEISNYTHHSSGHMYFTLKDESSRLRAIMFAGNNRFLKFVPKNGMKVIVKGYISVYERDGQYQFYAQEMQPDGVGQLYLAYEQLKEKLEKDGYFDIAYKKQLPPYPQRIGIITSTTGAAIRDIITTIKRRYPLVELIVYPVLVQGQSAAQSIAHAIQSLNQMENIDLLIVGRGGGSIEELWAFNEEIVAQSIYESHVPIISAVGHETDYTIADFVADIRAATPTAAAEIAVPHLGEVKSNLAYLTKRLEKQLNKQVGDASSSLERILKSIVFKRPKQIFLEHSQRIDHLQDKLKHSLSKHVKTHRENFYHVEQRLIQQRPNHKVDRYRSQLNHIHKQLIREMTRIKEVKQQRLNIKLGQLDALSPLKVMQRGYALPYDEQEIKLIKTIQDVQLGDLIKLHLSNGKLDCQVWGLEEKKK